jgi:hypothetical protein
VAATICEGSEVSKRTIDSSKREERQQTVKIPMPNAPQSKNFLFAKCQFTYFKYQYTRIFTLIDQSVIYIPWI